MIISFEGLEGAGTTTQSKLLYNYLSEALGESSVHLFREPGGLPSAEAIREVIMGFEDLHPVTEVLLFNAARNELVEKHIMPLHHTGDTVILDRYKDSTYAYQGVSVFNSVIKDIEKIVVGDSFTHPDICFYLDVNPEEGLKRKGKAENRFDEKDIDFYSEVRRRYVNLCQEKLNYYIVPTGFSLDETFNFIIKLYHEYVGIDIS